MPGSTTILPLHYNRDGTDFPNLHYVPPRPLHMPPSQMNAPRYGSFSYKRIYAAGDSVARPPWQAGYGRLWKENWEYVAPGLIARPPPSRMICRRQVRLDDRSASPSRHWEIRTPSSTGSGANSVYAHLVTPHDGSSSHSAQIPGADALHQFKPLSLALALDHPSDTKCIVASTASPRQGILYRSNFASRGIKLAFATDTRPAPPQSPVRRHGKRSRTPLPSSAAITARATSSESAADDGTRKKTRPDVAPRAEKLFFLPDEGSEFKAFADWLAAYLTHLSGAQTGLHEQLARKSNIDLAANRILKILMGYYPRRGSDSEKIIPTVAFLATWFLTRLFPGGLLGASDIRALDAVEALVRGFLLGLTFANKWLDDHSHPNKSWTHFCTLPLASINLTEKVALQLLDYDISITNHEWRAWLANLAPTTYNFTKVANGQVTAAHALADALTKAEHFGRLSSLSKKRDIISSPLSDKLTACLLEGMQSRL